MARYLSHRHAQILDRHHPEEHQKLKAITALEGESIKDYVLKRILGDAPALMT